jgi:hypothetical protein
MQSPHKYHNILQRSRKDNPTTDVEAQKTLNNQSKHEEKYQT